ncbi:MAG: hypothetical protein E6J35_09210, partial [Chloroflexi bacterium]
MTAHRMRARAFSAVAAASLVFGAIALGAGPASADEDELQPIALSVGQTDFIPLGARTAARIAAFVRLSGDPVAVVQSRAG